MTPIKILSLFLCFCLILEQSVFAQTIDLSHYFVRNSGQAIFQSDKFRPLHLRYISYDNQANDFKILLDKGDFFNQKTEKPKNEKTLELENTTQELMKYFFIGLSLPNEKFWVNLRPDSPDNILDPDLEKTDIGRIFLDADLQLKKDTASFTSPQNPEGKAYWDKLYKKAGELFGSENITIPTITRPWIVPNEIIIREAPDNAYIYKATLKVMLEEDYLTSRGGSRTAPTPDQYTFSDPRLKELNQYSTQLIKETIIPRLTYEVNTSKRYAPLRQVYYSLILAQWFKQKYGSFGSIRAPGASAPVNSYIDLIDSGNLSNLASSQPYDKQSYFQQYQKSFKDGEYNLQGPVYTPMGQSVRRYMSGGIVINKARPTIIPASEEKYILERNYLISSNMYVVSSSISIAEKLMKGIVNKYRQSLGGYPIKVHCLNVKDELILALISALNNPELKSFSNQENFFIMMFELIENAIKHGEGYPVEIYFRAKENNLIIEVKDYGKGIDFEKLTELLRGAAIKKFIQEHGYMKGVPVVMPPGRNGFIMTKIMLPEEVEAFIRNSKSEIPFVSGLSIDESRMIIGGVGLYAARRYAKDLGGDLTYETGLGGTTFIIKLPILSLASTGSAVNASNLLSSSSLVIEYQAVFDENAKQSEDNYREIDGEFIDLLEAYFPVEIKFIFARLSSYLLYQYIFLEDFDRAYDALIEQIPDLRNLNDHNIMFIRQGFQKVIEFSKGANKNNKAREFVMNLGIISCLQGVDHIEKSGQGGKVMPGSGNSEHNDANKKPFYDLAAGPYAMVYFRSLLPGRKYIYVDSNPFVIAYLDMAAEVFKVKDRVEVREKDVLDFKIPKKSAGTVRLYNIVNYIDKKIITDDWLERLMESIAPGGQIIVGFGEELGRVGRARNMSIINRLAEMCVRQKGWQIQEKGLRFEFTRNSSGSSGIVNDLKPKRGGIAFNALPIQTESVASSALGALPGGRAFRGDLDAEWARIQDVFNAGVRPSIQRLSEYTVAASASPLAQDKIDGVRVMLADILRRDEESQRLAPAEESCKQLLRALEVG